MPQKVTSATRTTKPWSSDGVRQGASPTTQSTSVDRAALGADQVVVVVAGPQLEQPGVAGRLDPPDQPGVGEVAEGVVDRLQAGAGHGHQHADRARRPPSRADDRAGRRTRPVETRSPAAPTARMASSVAGAGWLAVIATHASTVLSDPKEGRSRGASVSPSSPTEFDCVRKAVEWPRKPCDSTDQRATRRLRSQRKPSRATEQRSARSLSGLTREQTRFSFANAEGRQGQSARSGTASDDNTARSGDHRVAEVGQGVAGGTGGEVGQEGPGAVGAPPRPRPGPASTHGWARSSTSASARSASSLEVGVQQLQQPSVRR